MTPDAGGTRKAGGGTPGTAPGAALGELDIISRPPTLLGGLRDMWSSPSCRIAGGSLEGIRGGNSGREFGEGIRGGNSGVVGKKKRQEAKKRLTNIENLPVRWYE